MSKGGANLEFRDTMRQLWNTLRGLEDRTITQVQEELWVEICTRGLLKDTDAATSSNKLGFWSRGYVPGEPGVIDFLAEAGVRRAHLPPAWLDRFLSATGYSLLLRQERRHALFPPADAHEAPPTSRRLELPARSGEFLGRAAEVEAVGEAFESGWPVDLIEGLPGAGKTTLAREVAYACADLPRGATAGRTWPAFAFILWTTAAGAPLTLNDLLDHIAVRLGYPSLTQKPLTEKGLAVRDLLAEQPVLLVIDNFETISDLAVADFVVRVPAGVKVLLTSQEDDGLRTPIFRRFPPARLRLGGLPDAEALEFLRQAARRPVDSRLDATRARLEAVQTAADATLLPLVRATGGNPQALVLALGYIVDQARPLPLLVRDLYTAADSVAGLFDYLFARAWERCGEDARALWRVVPFFAGLIRPAALAATAGLRGRAFYDALDELCGRSLLEVLAGADGEPRYRVHPLVRAFAQAHLHDVPDFEPQARDRWIAWYSQYLTEEEDWASLVFWREEQDNILAVLDWSLASHHPDAPVLVRGFWYFLHIRGHWRLCETYTREAITQATQLEATAVRLRLAARLGWHLSNQGDLHAALAYLQRVEAEILALNEPSLLESSGVLNFLGQVYLWLGDWDRAEAYEIRHLALAEQRGALRERFTALYYLAWAQAKRGDLVEATQRCRTLVTEGRKISWERGEGYSAYRLAAVLVAQGVVDEAETWLASASALADRWEEPLLQAYILFTRAQLERRRSQLVEARRLARAALAGFGRLGARSEIRDAQKFLADLGETEPA